MLFARKLAICLRLSFSKQLWLRLKSDGRTTMSVFALSLLVSECESCHVVGSHPAYVHLSQHAYACASRVQYIGAAGAVLLPKPCHFRHKGSPSRLRVRSVVQTDKRKKSKPTRLWPRRGGDSGLPRTPEQVGLGKMHETSRNPNAINCRGCAGFL